MKFCGDELEPGSRGFYRLKVATMLDGSELTIPLHVVRGEGEGPTLGIMSGVHGTEYYQNRIIRRIVNEIVPDEVSGTILAVPVANPLAFSHVSRQSPRPPEETVDFANLNRVFPGRRDRPLFGSMITTDVSLTMRMAAMLSDEVIGRCDYLLDFHGQMPGMALKKMLYNAHEDSSELAKVFGLGIIHDPIGDSSSSKGALSGSTGYAEKLGIPGVTPEVGGGGHGEGFEAECERLGVQGVRNVMAHIGMVDGKVVLPDRQLYFRRAPHVRATCGGYLVSYMEAKDVGIGRPTREVEEGEVLARVYSPYTLEEMEEINAPVDGLLYACRVSGLVEAQSEVLAVADFEDSKWIE
ncbi:succinylglutamate desuccinylase/aspartoacylase family protein [Candidatus Bathyarchaeota archaeon]|nr:succinylglutamate desuccinylase/aspartoacylase family protein [Candidatus Bathyarchaeota archaeon]